MAKFIILTVSVAFSSTVVSLAGAAEPGDVVSWARVYTADEETYNSVVYREGLDVASAKRPEYVDVIAPQSTLDGFAEQGLSYEYLGYDCLSADYWRGRGYSGYYNYSELVGRLDRLATSYPDICSLVNYGTGHAGLGSIWGLKITNGGLTTASFPSDDPTKPNILVVGVHHAREPMTDEVAVSFALRLCQRYEVTRAINAIVNGLEIYVIPCLNVDGWIYDDVENYRRYWRKNAYDYDGDGNYFEDQGWGYGEGVDLNRNYTYMWGYDNNGSSPYWYNPTYRGPSAGSEPETEIIIGLAEDPGFVSAITLHSYGELILRPWGYYDGYSDDDDKFIEISEVMNEEIYRHLGHYYSAIGGWELYNTNGDLVDYMYGEHGTLALTIELNSESQGGFYPDESYIQPTCEMMDDALIAWATWCLREFGSGPGLDGPTGAAAGALTIEACRPNPARDRAVFGFTLPEDADGELAIYDLAGRRVLTVAEGRFKSGPNEYTADLSALAPGVYVYRLVAGAESAARKIVINR